MIKYKTARLQFKLSRKEFADLTKRSPQEIGTYEVWGKRLSIMQSFAFLLILVFIKIFNLDLKREIRKLRFFRIRK